MSVTAAGEPWRGPLSDVRIIALEQYGAGPFGSVHLADLGAEVIKIEDPAAQGDIGRYVPPYQQSEDNLFFETFNRNKRSISLDITNAAGREVFEDLVRRSDVVYSNLRGDVPEKLRIRYDDLRHLNQAIVCCSLSGFGMVGPRASHPGYDYIIQGLTGWMSLTGEPDGPPTKTGISLVDFSGGHVAALSTMVALHAARRDGVGSDCDVSLYDNALSLLTYIATWNLTAGYEPHRMSHSAHPSMVPFQNFQASDGWIIVGCAKEKFWRLLVDALDVPELRQDPRFGSFKDRNEHRAEVIAILEAKFLERSASEWLELLSGAGVPCAPVYSVAEALADPQAQARRMIVETEHPVFSRVRQVVSPVRFGPPGNDRGAYRRAPRRNEDAPYVLRTVLGYSDDHIGELRQREAFGKDAPG
jgi:crotonobetainyl-CoA:carnitine CoA-transferase CaiB-like acyl-CoA transferase